MTFGHFLACLLCVGSAPDDLVTASARVEAGDGKDRGDIVLEISFQHGVAADKAGLPAPILQIDVPPSVRLDGRTLNLVDCDLLKINPRLHRRFAFKEDLTIHKEFTIIELNDFAYCIFDRG